MSDGTDVLRAIDQLRRDLSGYHGQLKAYNDLQRHCDNQRERIGELEGLYEKAKAERDEAAMSFSKERDRAEFLMRENAKLRELAERAWKTAERLCQAFDGPCSDDGVTIAKPCPMDGRDEECIYGQLQKELLELGIEVGA